MPNLKENFEAVRASIAALDSAFAATFNEMQAERQDALNEQRARLEAKLANAREEMEELKQEAKEGLELLEEVKAGHKGVLSTASLPAKMLFDKLAERWDSLSAADLQMIEEVIDGKVIYV